MADPLPPVVRDFLGAAHPAERDEAWSRFLEEYSRLILHVVRSIVRDSDEAMDAYAWVLEHLRGGRCLNTFRGKDGARFTTWLVVVVRRMTLDFLRHERGRSRGPSGGGGADTARRARARLLRLGDEAPVSLSLPDPHLGPEQEAERAERSRALQGALEELDPSDRLLLTLRFEDGLSGAEIARVLGIPSPFHVYRRIKRLLPILKDRLRARGIEGGEE